MQGLRKLILPVSVALLLTGCSKYDNPESIVIAMHLDAANEEILSNGDSPFSMAGFEDFSKKRVCDELPEEPNKLQFEDLMSEISETQKIHYRSASALVLHGTVFCDDKWLSAYPEHIDD